MSLTKCFLFISISLTDFFFPLSPLYSHLRTGSYDGLALDLSMVQVISEQSGLKFRFGFCISVSPICSSYSPILSVSPILSSFCIQVSSLSSSQIFLVFRCILLLSRSSWFICVVLCFFFFESFASPNNYLNASVIYLGFIYNFLCIQLCIRIYVYILDSLWTA